MYMYIVLTHIDILSLELLHFIYKKKTKQKNSSNQKSIFFKKRKLNTMHV